MIVALVNRETTIAIFRIAGLLDVRVNFRAAGVREPDKFHARLRLHVRIEEDQKAWHGRRVLRIGATERRDALHAHRWSLCNFLDRCRHGTAGGVLQSSPQRNLVLGTERQNCFRREGAAACAQPDELAFHWRREDKRRNRRRFSHLIRRHHLRRKSKFECARGFKAAGRQKKLNGALLRDRIRDNGENQREPK